MPDEHATDDGGIVEEYNPSVATSSTATEDTLAMQKMRLNEAQWARILSENYQMDTLRQPESSTSAHVHRATSALTPSDLHAVQQTAYVLSLEGDQPNPKWTWWETALDSMVQVLNRHPR
jgi:hypothetical protein